MTAEVVSEFVNWCMIVLKKYGDERIAVRDDFLTLDDIE